MIKISYKILQIIIGIIIFSLFTVSSYALWDSYRIERNAYASLDYKPTITNDGPINLEDAQAINSDVVGWIVIKDTHIDYPVVQGDDDLEYINKDISGNIAPTGSIYLSAYNSSNFSDEYNILYGHHVNNNSMFGEITNYTNQTYLMNHSEGLLITNDETYDLEIAAAVETDAYDENIYRSPSTKKASQFVKNANKVLVLSTCEDETTNGRTIAIFEATPHAGEYPEWALYGGDGLTDIADGNTPLGMFRTASYWALLNLICLILICYNCLALHIFRSKFKRENTNKFKIGIIIELLISIIAIIFFILTEDIWLPIRMIDFWTPFMIVGLAISISADIIFCRQREEQEDDESYSE